MGVRKCYKYCQTFNFNAKNEFVEGNPNFVYDVIVILKEYWKEYKTMVNSEDRILESEEAEMERKKKLL